MEGWMDGRTDGRTDRYRQIDTDRQTDRYRQTEDTDGHTDGQIVDGFPKLEGRTDLSHGLL